MGRNIKPEAQAVVPVNGAVYRNSSGNGLIIDANGAQYIPSNTASLLASSDYPKYVSLNTQTASASNIRVSGGSFVNNGSVATTTVSVSLSNVLLYTQYPYWNTPFSGQSSKFWFTGSTASSGSYVVTVPVKPGYRQDPGGTNPALVFNTSGVLQSQITSYALHTWYDTSTSTYRMLGSTNGATISLYTSSDGITWSNAVVSGGTIDYTYFGSSGGPNCAVVANNQKVFCVNQSSYTAATYVLNSSTNGGSTFTDRSTVATGSGATFTLSGSTNACAANICYDGTTLFIPISSLWRYSTNDGAAFSTTTISGVVSTVDNLITGAIQGGNASTWMYVYSGSYRVYITTNGGQSFTTYSFTPVGTISGSYPVSPGAYDATNSRWCFMYMSSAGTYVASSTNNGATWTHTRVFGYTNYSYVPMFAFLDDAFYAVYSTGSNMVVARSTNGTTWTTIVSSGLLYNYVQPYYTLTDYVVIGDTVIKKSDQTTARVNGYQLIYNTANYPKNFGNYVTSDIFAQIQYAYTGYVQTTTSANAFTANYYSPYLYSQQQTANNANTIEYWRIK